MQFRQLCSATPSGSVHLAEITGSARSRLAAAAPQAIWDTMCHVALHPALTFQSSEHFLVTPTVSFNLTTPLVFFRFFMQPWKAGVEMLNLGKECRKRDR